MYIHIIKTLGENMEIITIINRKGGTGKTATAHAIGAGLAHAGAKVLFIDLDDQSNLSFICGIAAEPARTIYNVLNGSCDINDAIINAGNVDILPASQQLIDTAKQGASVLKDAVKKIRREYDYVIIDTPATTGARTIYALTASNGVIIPLEADISSLQGVTMLHDLINAVRESYNPDLKIYGLLLTRYSNRAILSRDMADNIKEYADNINVRLFDTRIRECIAIKEARAMQQDIFTYAPASNASADYSSFIIEMLKEV